MDVHYHRTRLHFGTLCTPTMSAQSATARPLSLNCGQIDCKLRGYYLKNIMKAPPADRLVHTEFDFYTF